MSGLTYDNTFARASIKSLLPSYTLGTQSKPFGGTIIANNSATGFAALDISNNVQRMLFMSSGNITYLVNALSNGVVGIASNGGQARWFITGSNNTNNISTILGNSTINRILSNTADGSDSSYLFVGGGGSDSAARGAGAFFYGNESVGTGSATLRTGNASNARLFLVVSGANSMEFLTNNTKRWEIDQYGQLISTNGSIRFTGDNQTIAYSVEDGISATGSTQADAYAIKRTHARISSASVGSGVRLPDIWGGGHITVYNTTGVTVKIYPVVGGFINGLATNIGYDLAPAEIVYFIRYGVRWVGFKVAV